MKVREATANLGYSDLLFITDSSQQGINSTASAAGRHKLTVHGVKRKHISNDEKSRSTHSWSPALQRGKKTVPLIEQTAFLYQGYVLWKLERCLLFFFLLSSANRNRNEMTESRIHCKQSIVRIIMSIHISDPLPTFLSTLGPG